MKSKHWYLFIFLLMPALVGLNAAPAAAADAAQAVVSTDWLQKNLENQAIVILDVRTEANYNFAHLPGAVNYPYVGQMQPFHEARQCALMPTPEQFTQTVQSLGINNASHVVVYDHGNTESDATKGAASVWILESMGHPKVSYLDGGFTKWTFEGRVVDNQKPTPPKGDFTAKLDNSKVASMQEVTENLKSKEWIFVDDRDALQYFGSSKNASAVRFGHLPGALCFPAAFMTNAGANRAPATLKSIEELQTMARGVGIPPDKSTKIITYCNSGQQAGMAYFVLHDLLGYQSVKVYDGSIIEYSAAEDLPLEKYSWSHAAR